MLWGVVRMGSLCYVYFLFVCLLWDGSGDNDIKANEMDSLYFFPSPLPRIGAEQHHHTLDSTVDVRWPRLVFSCGGEFQAEAN